MTTQPGDGLAKVAYNAYTQAVDFKNFQGGPMPEWDHLGSATQSAWRAAAHAAAIEVSKALSDPEKLKNILSEDHQAKTDLSNNPAPQITRIQNY